MIRVTMNETVSGQGFNHVRGGSYDLPDETAASYVAAGLAMSDDPKVKQVKPASMTGDVSQSADEVNAVVVGRETPLVNLPTSLSAHPANAADPQRLPSNFNPPVQQPDAGAGVDTRVQSNAATVAGVGTAGNPTGEVRTPAQAVAARPKGANPNAGNRGRGNPPAAGTPAEGAVRSAADKPDGPAANTPKTD